MDRANGRTDERPHKWPYGASDGRNDSAERTPSASNATTPSCFAEVGEPIVVKAHVIDCT